MRYACLLLFTKPARPGRVKTRLIAEGEASSGGLTPEEAAELHQAFLDDLVARLRAGRFDLWLAWAVDDDEALPESDLPSVRQNGRDLGTRLHAALSAAGEKHRLVGAIGSDHPEIELAEIERGFALLKGGVDVVLGPAKDGGYYFVGTRTESLRRELFSEIEWSTATVLEATLSRCREQGLSFVLLREGSDIDTPKDLERLSRRLASQSDSLAEQCPRTAALLKSWGRV